VVDTGVGQNLLIGQTDTRSATFADAFAHGARDLGRQRLVVDGAREHDRADECAQRQGRALTRILPASLRKRSTFSG
jgi:hypothetical protein